MVRPWDPWQALLPVPWWEELRPQAVRPAVDVYRRDGRMVVEMELPGVRPEDVEVRVHEDRVTVRAEVRHEEGVQEDGWFRTERRYGAVYRSIPLPLPVDPGQADARYRDGVLRIEAPIRGDYQQGRRVPVRAESAGERQ